MSGYIRGLEGWGGWTAAGSIFPLVVGLGGAMSLIGAALWVREWRRGHRDPALLSATFLAGSVAIWFLGKVFYLESVRSF